MGNAYGDSDSDGWVPQRGTPDWGCVDCGTSNPPYLDVCQGCGTQAQ